jgi:hypothetical protein
MDVILLENKIFVEAIKEDNIFWGVRIALTPI